MFRRVNRMKFFAKSQPNLLACLDHDECDGQQEDLEGNLNSLRSAVSIPNLADEEQQQQQPSTAATKSARRKSALIAQWENRILQN